ncbi:hypothetical protein [Sphingomonas abietis]|uniref:DUF2946 domain-containing protein n=1 Tax=Sphingomonas abietis TaxID=3012344 RepID=A0ABY7NMZ6_9SPHN|nr:hypothetical protein [Sphingomonas abietis]WBO22713.1 hypothetical protein PBT88_00725 [Sphingomonas abietis]
MPRRRSPASRSSERRRAIRRDILASLALVGAIFVSILALPVGEWHAHACSVASRAIGHDIPCGLSSLDITLDTDRRPFVFVSLRPL